MKTIKLKDNTIWLNCKNYPSDVNIPFNFTGKMITARGDIAYYTKCILDRNNGPAVEYVDGSCIWYSKGKLHRLNGPAIDWISGTREYYIEGAKFTEEQFKSVIQGLGLQNPSYFKNML